MLDLRDYLQAALETRYAIEREIGHGGMAVVYRARNLRHDRSVALRVLQPSFSARGEGKRRNDLSLAHRRGLGVQHSMWRAWVGFNFSHSLGLVMLGLGYIALGLSLRSLALPKAALLVPVGIGAIYYLLALRYWFRAPAIGTAAGTLCFIVGWWVY